MCKMHKIQTYVNSKFSQLFWPLYPFFRWRERIFFPRDSIVWTKTHLFSRWPEWSSWWDYNRNIMVSGSDIVMLSALSFTGYHVFLIDKTVALNYSIIQFVTTKIDESRGSNYHTTGKHVLTITSKCYNVVLV